MLKRVGVSEASKVNEAPRLRRALDVTFEEAQSTVNRVQAVMQDELAGREPSVLAEGASELALTHIHGFRKGCCVDDARWVGIDALPNDSHKLSAGPCVEIHRGPSGSEGSIGRAQGD
jgi:hypothetical protein